MRRLWIIIGLMVLTAAPLARADRHDAHPVLHEPISVDPREDVALSVSLDGEIPAAIQTPRGFVSAPDPAKPVAAGESPYTPTPKDSVSDTQFHPDRDTKRPDSRPYDDPFQPSTAPFKRLSAFDTVDASYTLLVRDGHTVPLAVSSVPAIDASEDVFYADMVVDLDRGVKVRIPSVAPGARVLHARAGMGTQDVKFDLLHDGADNWFILGGEKAKVRLVMQIAAPRAAFGGDFGNPSWAELLPVPSLPPSVVKAAAEVTARVGVSRRMSPRDDVTKLVGYFRSFTDSDEPPATSRDIYLNLALTKKGVCRHRAFAFMVTSLALGIPTRMIVNEAHAWVEVHDGRLWRRIDLGGAGRMIQDPHSSNVPHEPPPDGFAWPQGANRGEDLADRARRPQEPQTSSSADAGASSSSAGDAGSSGGGSGGSSGSSGSSSRSSSSSSRAPPDDRPGATLSLSILDSDAHRGAPLHVRGDVSADGEPCGHVTVELILHSRARDIPLGQLATDPRGAYDGSIVLPAEMPLGDYDVQARTLGDTRCGRGASR